MDTAPRHLITPILAGSGARLPAHVGVLQALKELGYGYRHLVGVSGGSVIAALAAKPCARYFANGFQSLSGSLRA